MISLFVLSLLCSVAIGVLSSLVMQLREQRGSAAIARHENLMKAEGSADKLASLEAERANLKEKAKDFVEEVSSEFEKQDASLDVARLEANKVDRKIGEALSHVDRYVDTGYVVKKFTLKEDALPERGREVLEKEVRKLVSEYERTMESGDGAAAKKVDATLMRLADEGVVGVDYKMGSTEGLSRSAEALLRRGLGELRHILSESAPSLKAALSYRQEGLERAASKYGVSEVVNSWTTKPAGTVGQSDVLGRLLLNSPTSLALTVGSAAVRNEKPSSGVQKTSSGGQAGPQPVNRSADPVRRPRL